jgi:serine/threonine protein kinase
MGEVHEAATRDERRVAVKVLLEAASNERGRDIVARFKREANITATLASPNIVPLLDAGIDDTLGIPFLVMPSAAPLARATLRGPSLSTRGSARCPSPAAGGVPTGCC